MESRQRALRQKHFIHCIVLQRILLSSGGVRESGEERHGRHRETRTKMETTIRSDMTQSRAVAMDVAAPDLIMTE